MSSWESGAFAAIQGGEEHSDRVPQQQPPKKKKHPGAGAERLAMATADDVVSPTSSSSSNRSQGEAFALPTVDDVSTVELMAPALHSIWRQQPWAFEFNEVLLSSMYDHVFSGVYVMADHETYLNVEYDGAKNYNSVGIILPFSADEEDMILWDKHVATADPICRKYQ
ncbi:hypothetical protein ATCC90586_006711 [Pythium insidiosum]|nr:hypothetical protein ATCC90586_006711 [Pythium insidiosum]